MRLVARLALAMLAAVVLLPAPATGARASTPSASLRHVLAAQPLELPPPPPEPRSRHERAGASPDLVALLARLARLPSTRPRGATSVAVLGPSGTELSTRGDVDRSLLPASTTKLVTAAAALRLLGPHHRFVTRVYATVPPDPSGVVDGDLIVRGGGDPALAGPLYRRRVNAARPATSLRRLARRVVDAGVARVRGDVLGDGTVLRDQPLAPGWRRSYLTNLDTTRSAGLTVDAGLRLFRRSGTLRGAAAIDPVRRTAAQFAAQIDQLGVRIDGASGTGAVPPGAVELARISSPPLSRLLAHTLQNSDNHMADTIFRMLGASTGDASWRGGADAVQTALADVDLQRRGVRVADGSGLSRHDRLTAAALVDVLRTMADGPLRDEWLAALAVSGRSGTMRNRLSGALTSGRVYAKTGTLRDVRAIAGTIPGGGDGDHHFAVLVNDLESFSQIAAARRLADVVALALVAAQDGCPGRLDPPVRTRGRAPERLICPRRGQIGAEWKPSTMKRRR